MKSADREVRAFCIWGSVGAQERWFRAAGETFAAALIAVAITAAVARTALTAAFARRTIAAAFATVLTRRTLSAFAAILASFALFTAFGAVAAFATAFAIAVTASPAATTAEFTVAATFAAIEILLPLAFREFDVGLLAALGGAFAAFGRRFAFSGSAFFIALEFAFRRTVAILLLLLDRNRRLHQAQHAEVMLSVLEIILAHHAIARAGRVTRELQVALVDHRGWSADLHVRAVALKCAVRVVVPAAAATLVTTVVPAARLTTAASLTLHCLSTVLS